MEEFLYYILKFVFEFIVYWLPDFLWVLFSPKAFEEDPILNLEPVFSFILLAGAGFLLGYASIFFFPTHFLPDNKFRTVNLFLTPSVIGLFFAIWGHQRRSQGKTTVSLESFFYSFIFTFFMALARYIFAK